VEEVGFSDPVKKKRILKAERIKYWISKGAQPSDSLHNLLITEKIIEGKKIPVHKKAKAKEGVAPAVAAPAPKAVDSAVVAENISAKEAAPKEPSSAKATEGKEPKIEAPAEPARIATQSVAGGEKKIAAPVGGEPRSDDAGREPPAEEKKIEAPKTAV